MSLYERIISRRRPLGVNITIGLLLILAPIAATVTDGMWEEFIAGGQWRPLLTAPVVILYILAVSRWLSTSDARLLAAYRPIVQIDDEAFDQIVRRASHISPAGEVIALVAGALVGLGISLSWLRGLDTVLLRLYVPVSLALMDGLLAWTIYGAFASTRLLAAIHRQPLKVNILDIKPLEPVGRYSLTVSLVFVGGIALGLIFGLDTENIHAWQVWLFYLPLLSVPFIIFFLNMRGTHRLLAAEKKRCLKLVAKRIHAANMAIQRRLEEDESLGNLAEEYTALIAYETRLRLASTWPYNTSMLRTLFFTILVPLLGRAISFLLFEK